MAGAIASVALRAVARTGPGSGQTENDGAFSPRRNQSVDQHDRNRGRRRCSKRNHYANRERRTVWTGAAAPVARADRARRALVLLHFADVGPFAGDSGE